jgi:hypothetical protein
MSEARYTLHKDEYDSYGILDSKHMLYAPCCSPTIKQPSEMTDKFNREDRSTCYYWIRLSLKDVIIYHRTGKVNPTLTLPNFTSEEEAIKATTEFPIL